MIKTIIVKHVDAKYKEEKYMEILKISKNSEPNKVAGAIVAILEEKEKVEITAIGAGAVNQAVKAIAVARGYIAPTGKNLVCIPAFTTMNIEDTERTGMKFIIKEEI